MGTSQPLLRLLQPHTLNNRRQNAEGSRSHQAHEAQHRAGRHRRKEGGVPRRVLKQLWAYIKKHNLQDPENKQYFTPDKKMAKVFGDDRIRAFGMAKFLSAHLS